MKKINFLMVLTCLMLLTSCLFSHAGGPAGMDQPEPDDDDIGVSYSSDSGGYLFLLLLLIIGALMMMSGGFEGIFDLFRKRKK